MSINMCTWFTCVPTLHKCQHLTFPISTLALSNVILSNLRFLYIRWMCKWCILLFVCLQYRYGSMYLFLQVCHVLEKVPVYLNVTWCQKWIIFRSFFYLNLEWLHGLVLNCIMWIYVWDTALYCCAIPRLYESIIKSFLEIYGSQTLFLNHLRLSYSFQSGINLLGFNLLFTKYQ